MMNQEETKEVKNGDKYNIPMLEKSFELLELLIKYPNGLTMQETVNLLNTPKTTVFRLLNSLLNMGYLPFHIVFNTGSGSFGRIQYSGTISFTHESAAR